MLFDLDGTLLDTAPDMIAALNMLRAEESREPLPYALARTQVSHGSSGLLRLAFPELAGDDFEQMRARVCSRSTSARLAQDTALFDGCATVLESLEQQGLAWGIVTNKPAFLTQPLLVALGLAQRAGCVVSGDTLPERKPHPAPLLHAARQLALPPQHCVYVGDAERDVQSARAAGMPVLLARYGYLGPDDDPDAWHRMPRSSRPSQILRLADAHDRCHAQRTLAGRVIAITGATGGIGRAVALACRARGSRTGPDRAQCPQAPGAACRARADRTRQVA